MKNEIDNYLYDLVALLRDKAAAAKIAGANGDAFQSGRHFALYEAISLIYQQALVFGIEPNRIGPTGFDPDRDVL